jgi:hypothetical protein
MRPWLRAVLKFVIMAATMSCGATVPRHEDLHWGDTGQRERDIQKAGRTWVALPKGSSALLR